MSGRTPLLPGFAVVIATRDRRELVVAAVGRLLAQEPDQVVVVDDGSSDGTAAAVRAAAPEVEVVTGASDGPASARNVGVEAVEREWVVFLDDDDPPDADWLATFRSLASANPDAGYLSVGYRELRADGSSVDVGVQPLGPAFGGVRANHLGGTFAVRTAVLRSVGGFTPGLRNMEFTDLALRTYERLVELGLPLATAETSHISIVGRDPGARVSRRPAALVDAMERTQGHLDHLWRRDPRVYALQLSTAGVAAARIGRWSLARRWLLAALRLGPSLPAVARLALAAVPPLGRRVWGSG